jgi:acyl carrier protein
MDGMNIDDVVEVETKRKILGAESGFCKTTTFEDMGLDDFDVDAIVMTLEEKFNVTIPAVVQVTATPEQITKLFVTAIG